MLNMISLELAKIIRKPADFPVPQHPIPIEDENRAGILVVRTRACVSMKKPVRTIAQNVQQIASNYPDIEWWIVRTEHRHGLEYLESCVALCAKR